MIRIFKLVLLLVVSQVAFGQAPSNYTNINGRYRWIAGMFDSTFHIPKGTSASLRTGGSTNAGALFYNTTDSSVYTYTGTQWIKLRGVVIDTTSLSNRINLKLNISDTASMLTPYLRKIDTTSMLSPYLRSNVAAATYVPQTRTITINGTSQDLTANRTYNVGTVTSVGATAGTGISVSGSPITSSGSFTITNTAPDQTVVLNNGTGISVSGTYPTFTITNTSPSSGGTVTSVGSGTGLSGGPITTSGTLSVDTLLMSTRAWRQKGIDSVQSNITNGLAGKVNISDTASMLTPYLRKIDTTAMLSPYLRANVAAATYVPQSRTITINGTSQDLSANRTFNVGTVTSVGITAGTGISVANSPVTGSGNITVTNTAPDQTVTLSAGTGISIAGTYPSFTITNSSPSSGGTVTSVGSNTGTGLTGGPITGSGTLAIDTALISTRLWRQKGVDSVAALANTKVSSVSGTSPISSSGGTSPTISISQSSGSTNGYLSSTDWTTFNNKQNAITLTTTGTSGAATLVGATLNIPQYADQYVGTVTSVAALTLGTTGTDLSSSVANSTTTPVITLNVPTASATNRGALSSTDWSTFNNKQSTITLTTTGTSGSSTLVGNTLNVPTYTLAGLGGISLTSLSALAPLSYNNTTGAFSIALATASTDGYLRFQDWNFFADKIGGSGTTNYIPKFTSSSAIGNSNITDNGTNVEISNTDLNTLFVTNTATTGATTGSGIGFKAYNGTSVTQSAGIFLTSNSWSYGTYSANQLSLGSDGTGGLALRTANSAPITFFTGGASAGVSSERMRLDASGNLGLGVTPSAWGSTYTAMQIGSATSLFNINAGSGYTFLSNNSYLNSSAQSVYINTGYATNYAQLVGEHRWSIAPSGTAGNAISFTQAMTLDASGRLGIGVTNPSYILDIEKNGGNASVVQRIKNLGTSTNDDVLLYFNTQGSRDFSIGLDRSSGTFNFSGASASVSSSVFMAIDALTGNVGIGTTSPSGIFHAQATNSGIFFDLSTAYTPKIKASGTISDIQIESVGNGGNVYLNAPGSTSLVKIDINGSERMRITSGGDVGINTQTPNATFHVNGSVAAAISIKTATYTLTSSDYTVVFDLNGNATANLPSATTCSGRIYVIKINRTNVSDVLTIDPNGAQTIDGNATYDLQCQQAITIQSDGSNWRIIGDYAAGVNCL